LVPRQKWSSDFEGFELILMMNRQYPGMPLVVIVAKLTFWPKLHFSQVKVIKFRPPVAENYSTIVVEAFSAPLPKSLSDLCWVISVNFV